MITPSHAYPSWYLGFDLGQRQDYTALATTELFWTHTGRDAVTNDREQHAHPSHRRRRRPRRATLDYELLQLSGGTTHPETPQHPNERTRTTHNQRKEETSHESSQPRPRATQT